MLPEVQKELRTVPKQIPLERTRSRIVTPRGFSSFHSIRKGWSGQGNMPVEPERRESGGRTGGYRWFTVRLLLPG